jgi:hypothetical protein
MAVPTNAFQTYQAIGNHEDMIDLVTMISPVDTYVLSNTASVQAEGTYHEWTKDTLAAAAANAVVEGLDAAATAVVPKTRVGNYTQILRKTWNITDTQKSVKSTGGDEESHQKMKNSKELAKDIEYALVINASSAVGASGTARQLKGILGWITTNNITGTGTGSETLTQTLFLDALQGAWAEGGEPNVALCGSFQKRTITNIYESLNTLNIQAEQGKVVTRVTIIDTDFGPVEVRLHRTMNTTASDKMVILDMKLWRKAWLRPILPETLARTGSSTMYMMEAELTLEALAQEGNAKVTELATS